MRLREKKSITMAQALSLCLDISNKRDSDFPSLCEIRNAESEEPSVIFFVRPSFSQEWFKVGLTNCLCLR